MRSKKFKTASFLALLCLVMAGPGVQAAEFKRVDGTEARDRIGDPKTYFTTGGYVYQILKRSHRDSMNGRFSDALIFSKAANKFRYKEHKDSHEIVVIGDPNGREQDPVTADAPVWNPIANTMGDDHPNPTIFLDGSGKELAVVYTGRSTQLKERPSAEGLIEFEVNVDSASRRSRDAR